MNLPSFISMKKPTVIAIIALVACAAAPYGVVALYEHRLSSDLRTLLIVANDPRHSLADQRILLDQMRPLIRTQKDFQVFDKFERSVSLMQAPRNPPDSDAGDPAAAAARTSADTTDTCQQTLQLLLYIEGQYQANGLKVPAELAAKVQRATAEARTCHDNNDQNDQSPAQTSQTHPKLSDDAGEGRQLQAEVRQELGMAPLEADLADTPATPRRAASPASYAPETPHPAPAPQATLASHAPPAGGLLLPTAASAARPSQREEVVSRATPPTPPQIAQPAPPRAAPVLAAPASRPALVAAPQPASSVSYPARRKAPVSPVPSPPTSSPRIAQPAKADSTIPKQKPYSAAARPSSPTGEANCPAPGSGGFEHVPAGWQFCSARGDCLSLGETRRCFR